MITLYDRAEVSALRRTADGYAVAEARVARSGVQTYLGVEVGMPDRETVRVYRPPDEVFAADAIRSYAYRPVTVEHPPEMVTAETWRDYARGQTGGDVVRDGEYVRVPLVLMDAEAIAEVESGRREISMGYTAQIVVQDGVTPDGERYDAIQRQMRMNHLAIVRRARGGAELRIGDGSDPMRADRNAAAGLTDQEGRHMADSLHEVVLDGLTIATTKQGAEAIAKLSKQVETARALSDSAQADMEKMKAEYEDKIAKLEAELDDMKSKQVKDSDIDALVARRAALIAQAKLVADADYTGMSESAIRRAAVVAAIGDAAIDGKSEAYVDARFDILVESAKAKPDTIRDSLAAFAKPKPATVADSQSAYEARIRDAWKQAK